jgi:hypothetical protein
MLNRLCTLLLAISCSFIITAQPTIHVNYHCDSATLWVNSPVAPLVYYWQGTTCGTDMVLTDTTFIAKGIGTTFYLRAYNTLSSTWASTSCATAIVSWGQYPLAPDVLNFTAGNLTLLAPPVDVINYAQGTSCGELQNNPGNIFPVSATGTYYFKAYDTAYKCWSTACTDTNIILVNALEYNKLNSKGISILPNPAVNKMTVNLPELIESTDLTVYDYSGRVVLFRSGVVNSDVIDLSKLNPGTYITRFTNGDIEQSLKLIISK